MAVDWEAKRDEFLRIFDNKIGYREGKEELRAWLLSDEVDFFTAPASSKFHGAYPGGLCEHSLDVYYMAVKMAAAMEDEIRHQYETLPNRVYNKEQFMESLTVATLFHDLCKVNFYSSSSRSFINKATGQKETKLIYNIDEKFPFGGHGSKSVFLLQTYLKDLKEEEAMAIHNHMGFSEGVENINRISQAFHYSPMAWITHVADEAAVYLLEERSFPDDE